MQALALKYRPKSFGDVVEQDSQIKILEHQIKTKTHKNTYLFTGPAGTGKTTCARIFANDLNEGKGNYIEVDAARNSGVDDTRRIINDSGFRAMAGKYKVYIIDECHMFSTGAWNSLLLTLEEPPESTIFILCTTDPQKIPATILSRAQRFDFKKITTQSVINRLNYILNSESFDMDPEAHEKDEPVLDVSKEAVEYIAKNAEGGMRDAITMLDKCLSLNTSLGVDEVANILGVANYDSMFSLVEAISRYNKDECIFIIEKLYDDGVDMKLFIKQFYLFLIDVNKFYILGNFDYIKIPASYEEDLNRTDSYISYSLMEEFMHFYYKIKWESDVKQLLIGRILLLCK